MYKKYWNLKEKPFENTPDPRFLYHSSQHEEGLSRLSYVVDNKKGAGLLTGVFGCGKTLLTKTLISGLNLRNYQVAVITNPQLKSVELLRSIARYLGAENLTSKLSDMSTDYFLEIIEKILINNTKDGRETLIVIDEAHVITELDVLEELRLLLNFQLENKFLLTLLLVGQPDLKERVNRTKQLLQRITLSYHIGPLSEVEVIGYVNHRMSVAGTSKQIFDSEAMESIHKISGGIPRRINKICDLCLLVSSMNNAKIINNKIVEDTVASFEVA